jgi:hypothetical protein
MRENQEAIPLPVQVREQEEVNPQQEVNTQDHIILQQVRAAEVSPVPARAGTKVVMLLIQVQQVLQKAEELIPHHIVSQGLRRFITIIQVIIPAEIPIRVKEGQVVEVVMNRHTAHLVQVHNLLITDLQLLQAAIPRVKAGDLPVHHLTVVVPPVPEVVAGVIQPQVVHHQAIAQGVVAEVIHLVHQVQVHQVEEEDIKKLVFE